MFEIWTRAGIVSILITIISTYALGYLSIYHFESYGWLLFILIPFLIGFLPPYIFGIRKKVTKTQAYKLSFFTALCAILLLFILAIEGLICVIMASPLLLLGIWLGSYIGFIISERKFLKSKIVNSLLAILCLGFMSFDYINLPAELTPVKTKIVIDAPIEKVWENVIQFDKLKEPEDWIFRTGISYPVDAEIKGNGVGAIRYCNFTTGSFVEPITTWNKPTLLQFDVNEQPIPMNEINPFYEVHPPHLEGYFKSYKGQFKLKKINSNKTELEGTTWYKVSISPEFYWKSWSDFIIHRIHKRVLKHIKKESE